MNQFIMRECEKVFSKTEAKTAEQIAKDNGCKILYTELDENNFGFSLSSNRCHTIVVNNQLSGLLLDFTICHELGHIKLHNGISTPFFKRVTKGQFIPKIEHEANEFALYLLYKTTPALTRFNSSELSDYLGLPYDIQL